MIERIPVEVMGNHQRNKGENMLRKEVNNHGKEGAGGEERERNSWKVAKKYKIGIYAFPFSFLGTGNP